MIEVYANTVTVFSEKEAFNSVAGQLWSVIVS